MASNYLHKSDSMLKLRKRTKCLHQNQRSWLTNPALTLCVNFCSNTLRCSTPAIDNRCWTLTMKMPCSLSPAPIIRMLISSELARHTRFSPKMRLESIKNRSFRFRLTKYLPHSRNLLRVKDSDKRVSLLKCGRLPVVSFLSELPQSEHDPQSFAVDLSLFTVSEPFDSFLCKDIQHFLTIFLNQMLLFIFIQ